MALGLEATQMRQRVGSEECVGEWKATQVDALDNS